MDEMMKERELIEYGIQAYLEELAPEFMENRSIPFKLFPEIANQLGAHVFESCHDLYQSWYWDKDVAKGRTFTEYLSDLKEEN